MVFSNSVENFVFIKLNKLYKDEWLCFENINFGDIYV